MTFSPFWFLTRKSSDVWARTTAWHRGIKEITGLLATLCFHPTKCGQGGQWWVTDSQVHFPGTPEWLCTDPRDKLGRRRTPFASGAFEISGSADATALEQYRAISSQGLPRDGQVLWRDPGDKFRPWRGVYMRWKPSESHKTCTAHNEAEITISTEKGMKKRKVGSESELLRGAHLPTTWLFEPVNISWQRERKKDNTTF